MEFKDQLIEPDKTSHLGLPVYGTILFKGKTYLSFNETGDVVSRDFADYMLPLTSVAEFRLRTNLTSTPLPGKHGGVNEIFGLMPYDIVIQGEFIDDENRTAYEHLLEFSKYRLVAGAIEIVSEIFNDQGIYEAVILDHVIRPIKGTRNKIPFQITMTADLPVELLLSL